MDSTVLVERVGELLAARQWSLSVAESATGGLLSHWITRVSGSSRFFTGGLIAYANEVKVDLLKVRTEDLFRWGAVSAVVGLDMAEGVRQALHTDVGIGITGIAGPTGATPTKPVGLYYLGLAWPGERRVWRHIFRQDRIGNNAAAATAALRHLLEQVGGWQSEP